MNVSELASPRRGWTFPAQALKDIEEAIAINRAGTAYIARNRLARALKAAYDLPVQYKTIADRLTEMAGGKW